MSLNDTRNFEVSKSRWPILKYFMRLPNSSYLTLVRGAVSSQLDVLREWDAEMAEGLRAYATHYLPYEILSWGGDVRVMFPKTCDVLGQPGISLNRFVEFWFAHPRTSESEYDFFCSKFMYLWNFSVRCFLGRVSRLTRKPNSLPKATFSRVRGHRRNHCCAWII